MMEGRSIDGFDGQLHLVSADDIKYVYTLESQSMYNWLPLCIRVPEILVNLLLR